MRTLRLNTQFISMTILFVSIIFLLTACGGATKCPPFGC